MSQWRSIDGELVTCGSPDMLGYLMIQLHALAKPYFSDDYSNQGGFDALAKKCVKAGDRDKVNAIRDLLLKISDDGWSCSIERLKEATRIVGESKR